MRFAILGACMGLLYTVQTLASYVTGTTPDTAHDVFLFGKLALLDALLFFPLFASLMAPRGRRIVFDSDYPFGLCYALLACITGLGVVCNATMGIYVSFAATAVDYLPWVERFINPAMQIGYTLGHEALTRAQVLLLGVMTLVLFAGTLGGGGGIFTGRGANRTDHLRH